MGVGGVPGRALGRRSAFLPAPTRRVQRPFVATFRDASEKPETGGGKGRGAEGSPRPGPARAVAFCSPAPAESSSQNSTSLSPLLLLESTSSGRERTVNHRQLPLVIFPLHPPTLGCCERGQSSRKGLLTCSCLLALGGSVPSRRPVPQPQPAARTPPGASHALLRALRTQEIPPKCPDSSTPRVGSSALASAALSLQTRVVPDPSII